MIGDARLREVWTAYSTKPPEWSGWKGRYRAYLDELTGLSDAELRTPERQKQLWCDDSITGVGAGVSVTVEGAYTDPAFVDRIVALRKREWPNDAVGRAAAIQREFTELLELIVSSGHNARRPHARLARLFAGLLPAELHCVYTAGATRQVRELLLPQASRAGWVTEHVLARARLRELLGPERDNGDHVERSVFCWWLFEQYEAILAGSSNFIGTAPVGGGPLPQLAVWAFGRQLKGLAAISRLSAAYRDMTRLAVGGADKEEILEQFAEIEHYVRYNLGTRKTILSNVRSVGLVEWRGELLAPTTAGEEFLESEQPDALIELFLVRVFPFAHLIRLVRERPRTPAELNSALRGHYSAWKTNQAPSQMLMWAKDLGLVVSDEGGLRLTPPGLEWEKRLPAKLPEPGAELLSIEEPPEADLPSPTQKIVWGVPSLEAVRAAFARDDEARRFVFDPQQLAVLHGAWHFHERKRFVILSGLSGAGKTSLLRLYAKLYLGLVGLPVDDHLTIVPVAPDWRDPAGLLGYVNRLQTDPTHQPGPATELLTRAAAAPHEPFFLILDEMNLARVEQYFAPLLSAMETGERIELYGGDRDLGGVPRSIAWPSNLFIGGTVNMDESTFPFSDKVLDRAFTLEFWDAPLAELFAKSKSGLPEVEAVLEKLQSALRPVRRHFGFRTAEEVLGFVGRSAEPDRVAMLDQAIFSKILPHIRGEESAALHEALDRAQAICAERGLVRSVAKLRDMKEQLTAVGLTKFWS